MHPIIFLYEKKKMKDFDICIHIKKLKENKTCISSR